MVRKPAIGREGQEGHLPAEAGLALRAADDDPVCDRRHLQRRVGELRRLGLWLSQGGGDSQAAVDRIAPASDGVGATIRDDAVTINLKPAYQPIVPLRIDGPAGEARGACGSAA